MQFATLVLIRHAHAEAGGLGPRSRLVGWYDAPLSVLGREQVGLLERRLAGEPRADAIYASPLARARETALAAPGGEDADLLDSLREIHCGELDGMPVAEVQARYPEIWRRNMAKCEEDFRWPGGESYRGFRARALACIRAIAARHAGGRVLIFTHAGVISQIIGAITGASAALWDAYAPGNASMSIVRFGGNSGELVLFNDRAHLAMAA